MRLHVTDLSNRYRPVYALSCSGYEQRDGGRVVRGITSVDVAPPRVQPSAVGYQQALDRVVEIRSLIEQSGGELSFSSDWRIVEVV